MDERSNLKMAAFLAATRCQQDGPLMLPLDGQDAATVAAIGQELGVKVATFTTGLRRGEQPKRCLVFELVG